MTARSKKSLREKIGARILRGDSCGIFLAPHDEQKTRDALLSQLEILAAESPQTTN
jgi:hypothetical protein